MENLKKILRNIISFGLGRITVLKAGTYYIGDPCYVITDWSKWCRRHDFDRPVLKISKCKCFVSETLHGDGVYSDNEGNVYPVDSGQIAAVPVDKGIAMTDLQGALRAGNGHIVKFNGDFACEMVNDRGVIQIGHLCIYTGEE